MNTNAIVGFCVSGVYGNDDIFELLIAYADGREIGHILQKRILEELRDQLNDSIDCA